MALLEFTDKGIYCPPADVYIDPWRPVKKALITHGHSDHARYGHQSYVAVDEAVPVIKHRLGHHISIAGIPYGETLSINGVKFSFHPAGHIPGSAQIRVERKGEVWVASGDYKREYDGISAAFQPVKCHTFITECTFGLPVFKWSPQEQIFDHMADWCRSNSEKGITSVLAVYALGKAQRVIKHLADRIELPIYTHGAIENVNEVLRGQGVILPLTQKVTDADKSLLKTGRTIVLTTPASLTVNWLRQFGNHSVGIVSGWMAMRGPRRRRAADAGFVLSDHADWPALNESIKDTGAEKIFTTHGYSEIFARWLVEQGYDAAAVKTEYTGENIDISETTDQSQE